MMGKKRKPFIDIHSHILPGVDDGSRDFEESLAMLRQAAQEGIGRIILTPHQKPQQHCVSVEGLHKRIEILQEEIDEKKLGITLYPGGELFFRQGLAQELQEGKLCTLAGSRYVLVEFYPQEHYSYIRDGLYSLLAAGYMPVVAHVERYAQVCAKQEYLEELLEMGCYYQINAGSLTGNNGFSMKRTAWKIVKGQMAHFVGTDAHRAVGSRSVQLAACAKLLSKKCGEEYAERLLSLNARMVLRDEEI